jgi:hypothetical protein
MLDTQRICGKNVQLVTKVSGKSVAAFPWRTDRIGLGGPVSLAWYVVLEREIPGIETFLNGKAADSLATEAGVLPLSGFFSASAQELTGFAADHGVI